MGGFRSGPTFASSLTHPIRIDLGPIDGVQARFEPSSDLAWRNQEPNQINTSRAITLVSRSVRDRHVLSGRNLRGLTAWNQPARREVPNPVDRGRRQSGLRFRAALVRPGQPLGTGHPNLRRQSVAPDGTSESTALDDGVTSAHSVRLTVRRTGPSPPFAAIARRNT
jgi:hypothetical protein